MEAATFEQDADRLRFLTNRVEAALASTADAPTSPSDESRRLKRAVAIIRGLDRRARLFPDTRLRDPAWAMLIELYVAHRLQRSHSVTSLCIAARVPQATALRHQERLSAMGMLSRVEDARDRRRVWVRITDAALGRMEQWLDLDGS